MVKEANRAVPGWVFRMAWRDSRRNRSRLFLFVSSIVAGIAALVAIYSFSDNLSHDIDRQAGELVGADLVLYTNREPDPEVTRIVDSVRGMSLAFSEELRFASMVSINSGTRLVQVRALGGDYPYYGRLETFPESAGTRFRHGQQALVDKSLLLQFNAKLGDSIKVGAVTFEVAGRLERAPGQNGISTTVAPTVFIPLNHLPETGLRQKGSRITYAYYFQLPPGRNADQLALGLDSLLELHHVNYETIASQKRETGRAFNDLSNFLSLIGFVTLLLGCIGVSSAIHIYINEKLSNIAVLRCLGASARQAFLIYLIQVAGVGSVGSVVGAALGVLIQQLLPEVLQDFLAVTVSNDIAWGAIGQGIGLGICISVLFALFPLVSIRNITPLSTLRLTTDTIVQPIRDRWAWVVYGLIGVFIFGYVYVQLDNVFQTAVFCGSLIVAFGILYMTARLLIYLSRRWMPASWSYLWRQGLSNLFRPANQTVILVISIGLGTAFLATLALVQNMLIARVALSASEHQPNMVLFDIQSSQKESVSRLVRDHGLPVMDEVPIVTVQLEAINGITAADARNDSTLQLSRRALGGELRTTYRTTLSDSEKITAGRWTGNTGPGDTARVSLEEGYARRLRVKIGDHLLFNVQGVRVPAIVGSFREVDWNRIQTNFRLIFPVGVIDRAPQFHVLMTRVPDEQTSARLQQHVVRQFPNVSIIDLGLILSVLDEILTKIGFVIRFMGSFSILTGFIVLIASVRISHYQRIRESVLLRTLGATHHQITFIIALEYGFLGLIAASTGVLIALFGSWALAVFLFEVPFGPDLPTLFWIIVSITGLTVIVGLVTSRGITSRSPLEVLRSQ